MGRTKTLTTTYACDRCGRGPAPSEVGDAELPSDWRWGRPRQDCYCPECCPAAQAFWKARDAWFDARVAVGVAAQAEAREKMKAWDTENPEPALEPANRDCDDCDDNDESGRDDAETEVTG